MQKCFSFFFLLSLIQWFYSHVNVVLVFIPYSFLESGSNHTSEQFSRLFGYEENEMSFGSDWIFLNHVKTALNFKEQKTRPIADAWKWHNVVVTCSESLDLVKYVSVGFTTVKLRPSSRVSMIESRIRIWDHSQVSGVTGGKDRKGTVNS